LEDFISKSWTKFTQKRQERETTYSTYAREKQNLQTFPTARQDSIRDNLFSVIETT